MPNMLDYIAWRGDLSFAQAPWCEADALVFSRLAYMPFEGIVPASADNSVPLITAVRRILTERRLNIPRPDGSARPFIQEDTQLLLSLVDAPRYADIRLTCFEEVFDSGKQEQFAAVSLLGPFGLLCAFRGTDGTLTGWKEDLNMSFVDTVPSQEEAVRYLNDAAGSLDGVIRLCGHSKGGNLAIFAGAYCDPAVQCRIAAIANFDGPGFHPSHTAQAAFQRILPRVHTWVPKSSIIGLLLEHKEAITIVESRGASIFQHNMYLWEITRGRFREAEQLTGSSQVIDQTLRGWLAGMVPEQRGRVINGIHTAAEAADATTLKDLFGGRRTVAVIKALSTLDEETRALTLEAFRLLGRSLAASLPDFNMPSLDGAIPEAVLDKVPRVKAWLSALTGEK